MPHHLLYHTAPRHITSRHATPLTTTPQYTIPHHATHHATPHYATSLHTTLRHSTIHHAIPHHATSHHSTSHHISTTPHHSRHTTPHHTTPHHHLYHTAPRHSTDWYARGRKQANKQETVPAALSNHSPEIYPQWELSHGLWGPLVNMTHTDTVNSVVFCFCFWWSAFKTDLILTVAGDGVSL